YRPRLLLADVRVQLIELTHLAGRAPTSITGSCVPQIRMCNLPKTASGVEPRGELIGERFILDKAVRVRRPDRLLIELLGLELAPGEACELGPDRCGAVLEVLGACLGPAGELPVMGRQALHHLHSLSGG